MKHVIENSSDLLLFTYLVEHKSFTALANHLDMNKSVVSKRIKNLENQLKTQLLIRNTRSLELTEAGRLLYERAHKLHDDFHSIYSELTDLAKTPQGTLRISSPGSFAKEHLTPLIAEFSEKYPKIKFDLMIGRYYTDIIRNRIDLGFHIGPLPDSSLIARKLTTRRTGAVASPEYLAKHGTPKSPNELNQHRCLTFVDGHHAAPWKFQDKDKRKIAIKLHSNFRATSVQVLKAAALNHMGIIYVAGHAITNELKEGRLCWILQDYTIHNVDIYAVYPQARHLPQRARLFLDFVIDHFRSESYWPQ